MLEGAHFSSGKVADDKGLVWSRFLDTSICSRYLDVACCMAFKAMKLVFIWRCERGDMKPPA